jgi:hypothetical protein
VWWLRRSLPEFPLLLTAGLAERDPFLGSLMVFPAYDAIRDEARFKRLAHELKFSR